jgi:hypothetical protein
VVSGFLPWSRALDGKTFKINTIIGWQFFFSQPLTWVVVLLFVIGVMGLLYFKQIRYAILSDLLALASFILLLQPIFNYPKSEWESLFKFGYIIGMILIVITFIATVIYHVSLHKEMKN